MKIKNTPEIILILMSVSLVFAWKADAFAVLCPKDAAACLDFAMLSPDINIDNQLFLSMFVDMQERFAEDSSLLDDSLQEYSSGKTANAEFSYYAWLEQIRQVNQARKKGIIKLPDLNWHPNFTPRALGLFEELVEKEDIIAMALAAKGSLARGFFMPGSDTDGVRIYHNIAAERIDSLDKQLRKKLADLGLSFSIIPELDIDWHEGLPERPGILFFKNGVWFLDEYGLDNPKQIARKKLFKGWDGLSAQEKGMVQLLHGLVCAQSVFKNKTELYLALKEETVLRDLEQRGLVSLEKNSIIVDWMDPPSHRLQIVHVLPDKDMQIISLKKRTEHKHTNKILEMSI